MEKTKIQIVKTSPDVQRGRILVNLIVDGKKKEWNMSKGLWEFVETLLAERSK